MARTTNSKKRHSLICLRPTWLRRRHFVEGDEINPPLCGLNHMTLAHRIRIKKIGYGPVGKSWPIIEKEMKDALKKSQEPIKEVIEKEKESEEPIKEVIEKEKESEEPKETEELKEEKNE